MDKIQTKSSEDRNGTFTKEDRNDTFTKQNGNKNIINHQQLEKYFKTYVNMLFTNDKFASVLAHTFPSVYSANPVIFMKLARQLEEDLHNKTLEQIKIDILSNDSYSTERHSIEELNDNILLDTLLRYSEYDMKRLKEQNEIDILTELAEKVEEDHVRLTQENQDKLQQIKSLSTHFDEKLDILNRDNLQEQKEIEECRNILIEERAINDL